MGWQKVAWLLLSCLHLLLCSNELERAPWASLPGRPLLLNLGKGLNIAALPRVYGPLMSFRRYAVKENLRRAPLCSKWCVHLVCVSLCVRTCGVFSHSSFLSVCFVYLSAYLSASLSLLSVIFLPSCLCWLVLSFCLSVSVGSFCLSACLSLLSEILSPLPE